MSQASDKEISRLSAPGPTLLSFSTFKLFGSQPRERRGFTLVEIIIAVAVLAILAIVIAPYLTGQLPQKDAETYALEAGDALQEARSSVMSGQGNARYGVHFEAGKFVLFQGAAYSSTDANDVVHQLPGFAAVTAVSLSPGGACAVASGAGNCDVHFASHFGTPTETGTVTLSGGGAVKTVTVGAAGMIDVN